MYAFVDRPVSKLDTGSHFLIWAMRQWVLAMSERRCAVDAIGGAFARLQTLDSLRPFLRMMATLNRHGLENFEFCAPACNHVSEHEAIIVGCVAALGDQGPASVRATLALMVEEEAVDAIFIALVQLAKALAAANLFPQPPGSTCEPRTGARTGPTGPHA